MEEISDIMEETFSQCSIAEDQTSDIPDLNWLKVDDATNNAELSSEECEECEDDDDEEDEDLHNLMTYSQTYLEFVVKIIAKVDKAIEQNRQLQEYVKRQSAHPQMMEGGPKSIMTFLPYFPPYFKDSNGMMPPSNSETLKIDEICDVDVLAKENRPWQQPELFLLEKCVKESLLHNQLVPLQTKKDIISEKLSSAGAETSKEQRVAYIAEMKKIDRRILYLKQCPDVPLPVEESYDDVDWAKISFTDFCGSRSVEQVRVKWCYEQSPRFSKSDWSLTEDQALTAIWKQKSINWDVVADNLGTNRLPYACFEHAVYLRKMSEVKRKWTTSEDRKLRALVSETGMNPADVNWYLIASHMPGKNHTQCSIRFYRSLDHNIKGPWKMEEDMLLLTMINKYGPQDWGRIADYVPNRSDVQCRCRWVNVLDTKRRNKPWLWEEHERLFQGLRLFGKGCPSKIALLLPGRNHSDVKCRTRALIKFKMMTYEAQVDERALPNYELLSPAFFALKRKRDTVMSNFRELLAEANTGEENQSEIIDKRVGLGSFVFTAAGESLDYSEEKQSRIESFGKTAGKRGRWLKHMKNPNEYGSDELDIELSKLPPREKRKIVQFLNQSNLRYTKELGKESKCSLAKLPDFYEAIMTPARVKKLNEYLGKWLPIDQADIDMLNKRSKRSLQPDTDDDEEDEDGYDDEKEVGSNEEPEDESEDHEPEIEPPRKRKPSVRQQRNVYDYSGLICSTVG